MRTITRHSMVVEHEGTDYEVPVIIGPVAEWMEPIVSLDGNELKVTYLVLDDDCRDSPLDDYEGAEFRVFDSGHQRNEWIERNITECAMCGYTEGEHEDHFDHEWEHPNPDIAKAQADGRFFWVERYEHGLVRYALTNESSAVDRQWDVAPACAYLVLDDEWFGGDVTTEQLTEVARSLLEEYTSWCNGDVYGIVHTTVDVTTGAEITTDSCWGFIGSDYAEAEARHEH